MLSTAVFYKEKIAPEMSFADFNKNIRLSYGVGQYYLLEIAGLRALRMLWSNLSSAYGDTASAPDIHAVTGLFNKTVYDPYVNMLRTTTEAMSAAIGGCSSMTVLPYNVCIGEADSFASRIARNTQLVLKDEAKFDRFVDPAKGSYFIEKATDLIAKEAWTLFKKIESEGGIFEALKKGDIQKDLAELKKKRLSNFSMRKESLVGTNFVPNYSEKSVCFEKRQETVQKPDIFGCVLYGSGGVKTEKINLYRLSEEFEKLRKATEKFGEKSGRNVSAFLATLGNLTMRKARASFAMGYLGAGGFEIIDNNGFADASEAASAALNSKAEIIVICSSDDEYPAVAPEIASKVKAGNPKAVIVLAGYPKEIVEDLRKTGVDEFIHLKSDSLETIRNIHAKLGITE
jgi:methylmalonyl-CoA mutase